MTQLSVRHETWPIRGKFTISRGSRTAADVVVVELSDGGHVGRGECLQRQGQHQDQCCLTYCFLSFFILCF